MLPTASRKRWAGITPIATTNTPDTTRAENAVTTRFLKPPQTPRVRPPRIIPIPLADCNQASSNAPPPKCLVTSIGRSVNPGFTRKLMIIEITMINRSPFHSQT